MLIKETKYTESAKLSKSQESYGLCRNCWYNYLKQVWMT